MTKNTPRIFAEAYKDYSGKFSLASTRGFNTMDLWCVVHGPTAQYETVVNGKTLYSGPSSLEAAQAYETAKLRQEK